MKHPQHNIGEINSVIDLQREQRRLRKIIRAQEAELRQRLHQVPGELFYSGVNAVVPSFLEGKITSKVLNAGKDFINKSILKNEEAGENKGLITAAKQTGLFTILRIAYKAFMHRKI
jgi:hypothetical protein